MPAESLPVSKELLQFVDSAKKSTTIALNSGETHELCFTVPESHCKVLDIALAHTNTPVTYVG
ncbi:hypothetical protein [Candidatus Enterovibrio altilux]|nr:hypothetical protein [Candidatus Enterovibrio luxaltus]